MGSGKRGFFGESCAAAINKKREVWEARKHGGLVVSGAGRGICIRSSRTPQVELGPAVAKLPAKPFSAVFRDAALPPCAIPRALPNWQWVVPTRHLISSTLNDPSSESIILLQSGIEVIVTFPFYSKKGQFRNHTTRVICPQLIILHTRIYIGSYPRST